MNRRHFLTLAAALGLSPLPALAARPEMGLYIANSPRPLPALTIHDDKGQDVSLPSGPLVINLWASWCLPCVTELPDLDRLKPKAAAQGVSVLALCLDRGGAASAANTFARIGIRNLEILLDHQRKAGETWNAPLMPTTLLVDHQGMERARFIGPAQWDGVQALALMEALAKGAPILPSMAPPLHRGG